MPPVDLPAPGDTDWYDWAEDMHATTHGAETAANATAARDAARKRAVAHALIL